LNSYQQTIHKSRYARYLPEQQSREDWQQTVQRYCDFWKAKYPDIFPYEEVYQGIVNLDVVPSMRALMTAGKALDRDNMAGFNCSYVALDDVRAFDEILYILMCGTGVGFSVERQYIAQLPEVAENFYVTESTIKVADSKIGWATALREHIGLLYAGKLAKLDTSGVRPAGAPLKTFGGRSSGPGPLIRMFEQVGRIFRGAAGRKLNSVECHDIVCHIADCVVVGGVRRSALISLSNLTDQRMANAKNGCWWEQQGQRALANNSVAYTEKPDMEAFIREWLTLIESKSGERGIFNRVAAQKKAAENGRRDASYAFGTNPCGEIILRSAGLCNLSEVIVRSTDTEDDLHRKVRLASIIGTFQSTLTNFRYVRSVWRKNAEEERLLGVSLTGIQDNRALGSYGEFWEFNTGRILVDLRETAVVVNTEFADQLGINPSVAVTTVKPSGTVSQLADCASGIHPRFAPYYVRTIRNDKKDPLSDFLITQGVPHETSVTKESDWVFSFPMKAPADSVFTKDLTAVAQLEHYLIYRKHWCEHNPSITVYVGEAEWLAVGAFVYEHFDELGGVSFLPRSDHVYQQAPYTEIDEATYNALASAMPVLDWSKFVETRDDTVGSQELACVSGVCEI
jgi:ribonucleoside-triphosphate reductase